MSSIQDIRALESRITDIVDDYIKQLYNEDDVLAIGLRCGEIILKADTKEAYQGWQDNKTIPPEGFCAYWR